MGRKLRIGAAIALVLVAGCVTVASATSSGENRSSDSDGRKVVVLDLVAQVVDRQEIDEAPAGQSLGDWTVLEVDLISGGNKVGEESSICVLTPNRRGRNHNLSLQGGLDSAGWAGQDWPSSTGQTKS